MDLVSIIIPYYKKKNLILDSINSVVSQTYKDIEILIVYDDESHDDLKFLEKIKNKDERIKLIINKKKMGAGISRNIGISYSTGKYVAFLDADDTWHVDKLKKQINFMVNNNYLASHTSYQIVDLKKNIIGKRIARNFTDVKDLLKSCDIGTSTVILKKEIFDSQTKFPNLKTKEDFVLWLKILKNNVSIYGLNEDLALWTKSQNSLSSSTFQKIIDGFRVYYTYMNFGLIKSFYYLICLSINFLKK